MENLVVQHQPVVQSGADIEKQVVIQRLGCAKHAFTSGGSRDVGTGENAPFADALALIVREQLTGAPPPEHAVPAVNQWREWIEKTGGDVLGQLDEVVDDQRAFAQHTTALLKALNVDLDGVVDQEQDDEADELEQEGEDTSDISGDSESSPDQQSMEPIAEEQASEEAGEGEDEQELAEAMQSDTDDLNDETEGDGETFEPRRPAPTVLEDPSRFGYDVFTDAFDEEISAEELCPPEDLARMRDVLDRELKALHGVVGRLANRLQRRLLAKQNRSWDFDLEE
ncbi:MAG: hypothetical protein AAFR45_07860, partial [Pseudomonadota bacterium]